jgi:hypothetical protein
VKNALAWNQSYLVWEWAVLQKRYLYKLRHAIRSFQCLVYSDIESQLRTFCSLKINRLIGLNFYLHGISDMSCYKFRQKLRSRPTWKSRQIPLKESEIHWTSS